MAKEIEIGSQLAEISGTTIGSISHSGNSLYSKFFDASAEVRKRWENKELRREVEKFLGGDIPIVLQDGPKAVLVRYVASPNLEFNYFCDLAELSGLNSVYFEYTEDKFVTKNLSKYYLCKLSSSNGSNKTIKIIDFNKNEGKKLRDVVTIEGKSLVQFHHELLDMAVATSSFQKPVVYDFSRWFLDHRNKDGFYYLHYLALFVCHGVLFENFLYDKQEADFTENIVIPAFKKIEELFGVSPLIFPLQPLKLEREKNWYGYETSLLEKISENIMR